MPSGPLLATPFAPAPKRSRRKGSVAGAGVLKNAPGTGRTGVAAISWELGLGAALAWLAVSQSEGSKGRCRGRLLSSTARPLPSSREDVDSCAQRHKLGYRNINGPCPCGRAKTMSGPGHEVEWAGRWWIDGVQDLSSTGGVRPLQLQVLRAVNTISLQGSPTKGEAGPLDGAKIRVETRSWRALVSAPNSWTTLEFVHLVLTDMIPFHVGNKDKVMSFLGHRQC